MTRTIIFDFDGTIADTLGPAVMAFNKISSDLGLRQITDEEVQDFRNHEPKELLAMLGLPLVKLAVIVRRVRKSLSKDIDKLELIPGMRNVVESLHTQNIRVGILTSNSSENVFHFLDHHNIHVFDFIYGSSSLFGKDKVIKKAIKEHDINEETVIYVGDETRDIQACKKVGIKIASVTWGFNTRALLQKEGPDWLIDKPEHLLKVLSE